MFGGLGSQRGTFNTPIAIEVVDDQIIVLEDGEMAGCGTHEELLAGCEVYQEIYYSQYAQKNAVQT